MKGYRGFLREMARTGSHRAAWLQLRTGARHVVLRTLRRGLGGDAEARFLENYGADGVRAADLEGRALALDAQACLVCGLCSAACARAGGRPALDPRDAVLAAARLVIDARRLGLATAGDGCAACHACEPACPAGIPIAQVQQALASLGES